MKKRIISLILILCMTLTLFPMAAVAAGSDFAVTLEAEKSSEKSYNSKDVVKLNFKIASGASLLGNVQSIVLAINLEKFDLLNKGGQKYTAAVPTDTLSSNIAALSYFNFVDNDYNEFGTYTFIKQSVDGKTLIIKMEADWTADATSALSSETTVMSVLIGLKSTVDYDNISTSDIRLATASEAIAGEIAGVSDGTYGFYYKATGSDELAKPMVTASGFTFVKPALAGEVSVSGTPKINEVLTAVTTGITSTDPGALTYKWYYDGTTDSIGSAVTYTPDAAADVDKTIKVDVSAANYSGVLTGTASAAVSKAAGPEAPTIAETGKTDTTITVTENSAWEYTKDGTNYQDSNIFTGLTANTAYSIQARVKATATNEASAPCSVVSITTTKASAGTPVAPVVQVNGNTYISVFKVLGQKYICRLASAAAPNADAEEWNINNTFTGLTPVTDYKIYTYIPETATTEASDIVFTEVTTNQTPINDTLVPVSDLTGKTYSAAAQEPTFGGSLTMGVDYGVSYSVKDGSNGSLDENGKPVGAGTYIVSIGGKGDYTAMFSKEFTIDDKPVTITPDGGQTKEYGANDPTLTYTTGLTDALATAFDTAKTGALARATGDELGNYAINIGTLAAGDNFDLTLSSTAVNFSIIAKNVTETRAAVPQNVVKSVGDFTEPTFGDVTGALAYSYDGATDYADVKTKLAALAKGATGSISWTYTANGNYSGTISGSISFTVVDVTFTVGGNTVSVDNALTVKAAPVYGDTWATIVAKKAVTVTAAVGEDTDADQSHFTLSVSGIPNAGDTQEYKLLYNGTINSVNYTDVVVCSGTVNVAPKTLTAEDLEYTGSAITKEYDGTTGCTLAAAAVAVKSGVLVGDDALTISGTVVYNSKDVAAATKVTFTPTAITTGNYRLAATETLDITAAITKAPLTIDDITAAPKTYDGTTTASITSVEFTGLKNSETLTKDTDYTVAGVFDNKNVASANEITATVTLSNGNYSLAKNTVEKTATIAPADYTVTVAATQDIKMGSGLPAITVDDNIKGEGVNDEKVAGTLTWYIGGYSTLASDASLNAYDVGVSQRLYWRFIATDTNYDATPKDGSTMFTIVAGDPQTLTFSGVSGGTVTETYGDAKFTFAASNNRDDGGTITYTSSATGVATVDSATGEVTIVGAGTATITAKAAAVSGKYAEGTASYTLNVNTKPITVTGVSAADKAYDGGTAATITGTASVGTLTNASLVTSGASAAFADKNVGEDKTVTFSGYTLTGTGAGNYSLSQPASVTADITAKELNVTGATLTGRDYNGATDVEVTAVTLSGVVDTEAVSVKTGTGGVTGTISSANAGSYTSVDLANIALDGADKDNYSIEAAKDDVTTTVTIDKATWGGTLSDQDISWKYTVTGEKSADFPTGLPGDRGTTAYDVGTVINTDYVLNGTLTVNADTGEVTYTLAGKTTYTAGQTATIPVVVTMQNYEDVTVDFVITLTDKDVPVLTADNLTITYTGSDIPVTAVTGKTAKFNGADVAGIWSWESTAPKNATPGSHYMLVFTPTDSDNYETAKLAITVTVNKKDPTGTPSYTAISAANKTLADAALAVGSITPAEGTIKWVDGSNAELPADTAVTANTYYKWLFTPTDSGNYNILTGSIKLYSVSTGGGGGVSTYPVTVTAATGGTITVSPEDASRGTIVTVTIKTDEGYTLDTLSATDRSGKTVELTKKSDDAYTFMMPGSGVTVAGTFKKAESPVNPFVDVTEPDWFYDDVMFTFVNGMMQGVSDDLFDVHGSTTRGMIVTVLYRMENEPDAVGNPFDDVENDKYYARAVAWAAANKIVNGYGPGRFGPEDHVTREQVATILYNYAVYKGYDVSVGENTNMLSFKDALDIHDWAMPAMQWACGTGLIRGYDGYLTPRGNAERCQIAAIFHRFCDVVQ